ncbi:MAG: hypothetical protein J2P17_27855, partial [Mycobacterium sp.]|nr:hypothetical protein [Mycobacterium sp.]
MTASDFGAFTLVYVGLQLGIVLGRASANMPMMIKYGASESRFGRPLAAETLGVSAAVGML